MTDECIKMGGIQLYSLNILSVREPVPFDREQIKRSFKLGAQQRGHTGNSFARTQRLLVCVCMLCVCDHYNQFIITLLEPLQNPQVLFTKALHVPGAKRPSRLQRSVHDLITSSKHAKKPI